MTHVFLGITIVGIILAVKVVLDGLQTLAGINDRISAVKIATQSCLAQKAEEEARVTEKERQVQELKTEVEQLVQKEKDTNAEIRGLRTELDGQSFKIDL